MQAALQTRASRDETVLTLVPGTLDIGQADNNHIRIDDATVSHYHARIVTYFQEAVLIDLNSKSGTWLNGQRIKKHSIKAGDIIQLGNQRFIVRAPSEWFL